MEFPNETISELTRQAAETLPTVLLALGVLVAGWILARILRALTGRMFGTWARKLTPRLSKLVGAGEVQAKFQRSATSQSVASAAEALVFWVVFLVFVTIATDMLGLDIVSDWLTDLVGFLPEVAAAGLVVLLGVLVGSVVRTAVTATAGGAGFAYPHVLGQTARAAVLLVAVIVAFDQIGLEIAILIVMVAVITAAALGGGALAFGLGARTSVSNILASHYLLKTFRVGHRIRIGEVEGRILEITPTSVIVESGQHRTVIPASRFSEQEATLLSE